MPLNSLTYGRMSFAAMQKIEREQGNHWFGKDEMRFFGTRLVGEPNRLNMFITSEQYGEDFKRKFTIRMFNPRRGMVATIGNFQGFDTAKQAQDHMRKLADILENLATVSDVVRVFDDLFGADYDDNGTYKFWSYGQGDSGLQHTYEVRIL